MDALWNHIVQHMAAYGFGSGILVIAFLQNMPTPGTKMNGLTLYTWIYNSIQTALPVKRAVHEGLNTPTLQQSLTELTTEQKNGGA